MRETNGAISQLKPRSTKVYSNGSIGYNLLYPEKMNIIPNREQRNIWKNFLTIILIKKKRLVCTERLFFKLRLDYFKVQVVAFFVPLPLVEVVALNWQINLASPFVE
jgi:hypothetical protein